MGRRQRRALARATHPGDNLYTSSVLGLDPDTGKIKAFHQYHQNDSWDWDEVDAPMLIDMQRDGRSFKSLIHPGRDAIFWVLERKPDRINYVAGWPFVNTDVWKGIEPETGRPIVDPDAQAGDRQADRVLSVAVGRQGLAVGGIQPKDQAGLRSRQREFLRRLHRREGAAQAGRALARHQARGHRPEGVPVRDHFGELQAWDPATGKKVWSQNFKTPSCSAR